MNTQYEIQKDCQGAINDAEFFGSEDIQEHNFVCGMKFEEANEDDIAGWTCVMEQCASEGCKGSEGSGTLAYATIHVMVRHHRFRITICFDIICTIFIQYCLSIRQMISWFHLLRLLYRGMTQQPVQPCKQRRK